MIADAFTKWGSTFTIDCKKEESNQLGHKWFNRNNQHLKQITMITRNKLDC